MGKTKILFECALASALALPLWNCGSSPHDPTEAYYLVATNVKVSYWQAAAAGLERAGRTMQVKWEMSGPDTYDPAAEREAFRKVVQQGKPSGILVSVADPNVMKPEIDAAVGQGIPVITIDSDAPSSKRMMFIGTDNYDAGRMGGGVVAKQLNGKGNVVAFTMPEQTNLKDRLQGYEQAFRGTGIKIAEVVDIKGDPRIAFDRTMEITQKNKPSVDAFVCLEALACPEVAEVLNRNNVKGKTVVAMDTDQRTLDWIQKGLIAATIAQKPYTMAYFGAMVLDDIHHHKPASLDVNWAQDTRAPVPAFIDTGRTLIDNSNIAEFQKVNAATSQSR